MLLCFDVIINHFGYGGDYGFFNFFYDYRSCAVPIFMMMSFALTAHHLFERNYSQWPNRLFRIALPHVFWTAAYFIVLFPCYKIGFSPIAVTWNDLVWQLTTGSSYNRPMWYMVDLLLLTAIVFAIFRMAKNNHIALAIVNILMVGSWVLHYSGISVPYFSSLRGELSSVTGRFFEMVPFVALGIDYAVLKSKWQGVVGKKRLLVFIAFLAIAAICFSKPILWEGFGYIGWHLTIMTIAIFAVFDMARLTPPYTLQVAVNQLSRYTLGIFCIHMLIGMMLKALSRYFDLNYETGFFFCVAVYILSYMASWCVTSTGRRLRRCVE